MFFYNVDVNHGIVVTNITKAVDDVTHGLGCTVVFLWAHASEGPCNL